jgi:hypothetical protein
LVDLGGVYSALTSEIFALTLSAILAVVITFLVQSYLDRPKVRGNILNFISASITLEFLDVRGKMSVTAVFPFLFLTNLHQSPISILDFVFEVDIGKGWLKMEKLITDEKFYKEILPRFLVLDAGDRLLRFPNLDKALLERKLKPINYGDYLHGFLTFASKASFLGTNIKRMRLTSIDVFQNRHVIKHPLRKWRRFWRKEPLITTPLYIFEQNAGAVSEWKKQ